MVRINDEGQAIVGEKNEPWNWAFLEHQIFRGKRQSWVGKTWSEETH